MKPCSIIKNMNTEKKYNKAIIIGASVISDTDMDRLKKECDDAYTVVADAGMEQCMAGDIRPDLWVGDMDSAGDNMLAVVKSIYPDMMIETCSPIKDDTDMAIAVKKAVEKGGRDIVIYGGLKGDRMDHSLANIQLLHHFKSEGVNLRMISDSTEMYCLIKEEKKYDKTKTGMISLFSLTDKSDISIKGLYYEYEGVLKNSYALGVSNEFCGREACIRVDDGVVLVVCINQ